MDMVELLAPAGSLESFYAALDAGADAVYAGGNLFGARAYAKNFTQEEYLEAIRHAHSRGKKLYMTVNTLLKNRELQRDLYDYLLPYYEEGLDAVIVQDMGVLRFVQKYFPGLPIHVSTQATVTGPEGMRFFQDQPGVTRVVPARELSLQELQKMHEVCSLEIETFIHGALCYSYSGQCLFSSLLGGRSGNRGRCAQPCRLPYQVHLEDERWKTKKEICPLSLKDICTLDILPEILEAGVTSLKIEGRMKKLEYTQGVVAVYRKYLDRYLKAPGEYQVDSKDRRMLLELFNRGGSCDGYYRRHNGKSMMAFTNDKKIGRADLEVIKNKEKVKGNLILYSDNPAILELEYAGCKLSVQTGEVQKAQNQPMTRERILTQMRKSGNTPYILEPLTVVMEEEIFLPVKTLNELRRLGFETLQDQLAAKARRQPVPRPDWKAKETQRLQNSSENVLFFYASCETREQFSVCEASPDICGIYGNYPEILKCLERGNPQKKELFLMFPHVERMNIGEEFSRESCERLLRLGLDGFLVRSLESFARLKEYGFAPQCVLDSSVYTWNGMSQEFWYRQGILRDTVPLELNCRELLHRDNQKSELLVYGYLPLMLSAQCVQKNLGGCNRKNSLVRLKDRYGKVVPVQCHCDGCYNVIYNSLPYGLGEESAQVKQLMPASLRLSFTLEGEKETRWLVSEFTDRYCRGKKTRPMEMTKGHFKRGVE